MAQAVNNISENAMWNSNRSIKFPHLWKLANQRWVHVIETTKACKVPLTKARGKIQDDELSLFKASNW